MMRRGAPLELRSGMRVRFGPDHRIGELVRPSPNGEEWLVKDRLGRFWVSATRLELADETAAR
ncbi:MAG: hypothetical protein E6I64_06355 [Chloroflexi bacterium]|nr:MAG: hypothetical protein E6I64_06355 [Chloroflexota bacterium]